MIDRLVHHAEVLTLPGDSYHTRQRRELLAKQTRTNRAYSPPRGQLSEIRMGQFGRALTQRPDGRSVTRHHLLIDRVVNAGFR